MSRQAKQLKIVENGEYEIKAKNGNWYSATVTKKHSDGTYDAKFNDHGIVFFKQDYDGSARDYIRNSSKKDEQPSSFQLVAAEPQLPSRSKSSEDGAPAKPSMTALKLTPKQKAAVKKAAAKAKKSARLAAVKEKRMAKIAAIKAAKAARLAAAKVEKERNTNFLKAKLAFSKASKSLKPLSSKVKQLGLKTKKASTEHSKATALAEKQARLLGLAEKTRRQAEDEYQSKRDAANDAAERMKEFGKPKKARMSAGGAAPKRAMKGAMKAMKAAKAMKAMKAMKGRR